MSCLPLFRYTPKEPTLTFSQWVEKQQKAQEKNPPFKRSALEQDPIRNLEERTKVAYKTSASEPLEESPPLLVCKKVCLEGSSFNLNVDILSRIFHHIKKKDELNDYPPTEKGYHTTQTTYEILEKVFPCPSEKSIILEIVGHEILKEILLFKSLLKITDEEHEKFKHLIDSSQSIEEMKQQLKYFFKFKWPKKPIQNAQDEHESILRYKANFPDELPATLLSEKGSFSLKTYLTVYLIDSCERILNLGIPTNEVLENDFLDNLLCFSTLCFSDRCFSDLEGFKEIKKIIDKIPNGDFKEKLKTTLKTEKPDLDKFL